MVTVVAGIFAYYLGAFYDVYKQDSSNICFLIYGLYVFASLWCGWKTYNLSGSLNAELSETEYDEIVNETEKEGEIGWFISELCLTLGMIGTVYGFILMFHGDNLLNVNAGDQQSLVALLTVVAKGMSTALYTTLIGLIASSLLKVQYFNLSHALDGAKIKGAKNVTK